MYYSDLYCWQLPLSIGCDLLCLYDLWKYCVIFLVAYNNSAIWSGLLVEMDSCKCGLMWLLILFLLLLSVL